MNLDWLASNESLLIQFGMMITTGIVMLQRALWAWRYGKFCVKCGSYGGKRKVWEEKDDAPLEFSEEAVKSVAAKYKYLHDELMSEYNSPEVKAKLCQIGIPNWRKHLDKEEKSD